MKNLRFYIIFGVTALCLIYILFVYQPKYLLKFKNKVSIDCDYNNIKQEDWEYVINNNNLELSDLKNNTWTFKPKYDGESTVTFYYRTEEQKPDDFEYKIEYTFKIVNNKIYWITGTGFGIKNFTDPY